MIIIILLACFPTVYTIDNNILVYAPIVNEAIVKFHSVDMHARSLIILLHSILLTMAAPADFAIVEVHFASS